MAIINWLKEISRDDIYLVGEKAVRLAELYNAKFPVPFGFCITTNFFKRFLEENGLKRKIENLIINLDFNDRIKVDNAVKNIQALILNTYIPSELKSEILNAYNNMNVDTELYKAINSQALSFIKIGRDLPFVAVRNSIKNNSSNNKAILNVKGSESVVESIKKVIANAFNVNMLKTMSNDDNWDENNSIAILVQKMVNASRSGIAYIQNDDIIIKSIYGLAELLENNNIITDKYIVDKNNYKIKDISLNKQDYALIRDFNLNTTLRREIPLSRKYMQILNEEDVIKLAKMLKEVEYVHDENSLIEWAVEDSKLYILRSQKFKQNVQANNFEVANEIKETNLKKKYFDDDIITEIILDYDKENEFIMPGIISGEKLIGNVDYNNVENIIAEKLVNNIKDLNLFLVYKPANYDKEFLKLEFNAIKKLHNLGYNNIGLAISSVVDVMELREIKNLVKNSGLEPNENIDFGIIVDKPASVQLINELVNEQVDFVIIDVKNLTRLTLGEDYENLHISVNKQIKTIIENCRKNNVEVTAFNINNNMIQELVKIGVDCISVNQDDFDDARQLAIKAEKRLLLDAARSSLEK